MVGDVFNIIAIVLAAIAVLALVVIVRRPDRQREQEDAARAYFDAHGRWPDEQG
jgi:hypothetical protein